MPNRGNIFRHGHEVYRADDCQPLVDAVGRGSLRLVARARSHYPGARLPAGALPGLMSVGFWDAQTDQEWGLDWHRNEGIELTFLESGTLGFAVEGRRHQLDPGTLTITRPWQPHRVGLPNVGRGRLHWVILDVGVRQPHQAWDWPDWLVLARSDLAELSRLLRQNHRPVWPDGREVGPCFSRLAAVLEEFGPGRGATSRLAVLLNELFVDLLDLLRDRKPPQRPALASAQHTTALVLREVEANPGDPWTLESMAERAGLKRTRFAHYVWKLTNRTPMHHLAAVRAEAARKMLAARPDLSVTEVAFACGFSSSQYFATVFRRQFGIPPRQVRTPGGR